MRRSTKASTPPGSGPARITSLLDLLGESVTAEAEAVAARDQYLTMLDRMATAGVEVNVSVKLTQMGLDIAEDLCQANMVRILEKAGRSAGSSDSTWRARTIPSGRWTSSPVGSFRSMGSTAGW